MYLKTMEGLVNIILFYFLYSNVQSAVFPKKSTESFIIHYLEDRRVIPVRVELNSVQQTEHIISPSGEETLYDFIKGKVAYKDPSSSQCFIADIAEESLERDRKRLRNLQNGIVRGFYLPTFHVQEEFNNSIQLSQMFGTRLIQFCDGNIVSSVTKHKNRRKRYVSGEKGQFTHHSYGHYGHQSNNYAHYGHETHITGTVDKDGNIRDQRVNHNEVRSQSSQTYPGESIRTGPQISTTDSRTGIPGQQFQTQYRMPSTQQVWGVNGRPLETGSSGQFSLQTTQESGYQLNLPLGLRAGNAYRGGIQSGGHYRVGGPQPQIKTEYKRYPDSVPSGIYHPTPDQTYTRQIYSRSPPTSASTQTRIPHTEYTKIQDRGIGAQVEFPGSQDFDQTKTIQGLPGTTGIRTNGLPSQTHPGISATIPVAITEDRRVQLPVETPGMRTFDRDSRTQILPSYTPGSRTASSADIPGQPTLGIGVPSVQTTVMQPPPMISRPAYETRSTYPDLRHQQQYIPGLAIPSQHLQTPDGRSVIGSQIHSPYPPTYPSFPGSGFPDGRSVTLTSPPGITAPGMTRSIPQETLRGTDGSTQNGILYPTGFPSQIPVDVRQEYPGGAIPSPDTSLPVTGIQSRDSRILPTEIRPGVRQEYPGGIPRGDISTRVQPRDSRISTTEMRPGIRQEYPGGIPDGDISTRVTGVQPSNGRISTTEFRPGIRQEYPGGVIPSGFIPGSYPSHILSRGIPSETTAYGDISPGQIRSGISGLRGQDSASSQTQIQTNIEGTAAEASAAGQHRGLGSQTQVQGGYAGNGSFSAQAQSGFTGGVAQSQVQGNKQGGLSGSSAQVERVGSAQSQVQVGKPSGTASSTAQGKFSGGVTQVQAQSGKSGGSAGAQAQSTGLSSSHVQVNIGGKEVGEQDRFQGTVSASVQGGHTSGQAQTQLQGGYDSGRTYVATAQGGFDSSTGFQVSVPAAGSIPSLSNQAVRMTQPGSTYSQQPQSIMTERQPTAYSSVPSGASTGLDFRGDSRTVQTTRTVPTDQATGVSRLPESHVFARPSDAVLGHRQTDQSRLPQQHLISPGIVPQQTTMPRTPGTQTEMLPHGPKIFQETRAEDSRLGYPSPISGIPGSPHLPHTPQLTYRHPYPGYQTDSMGISRGVSPEHAVVADRGLPAYTSYGQNGLQPPSTIPGSQQSSLPPVSIGMPSHLVDMGQPSAPMPREITPGYQTILRESSSHLPSPQQLPPFLPASQQTIYQQHNYTTGIPVRYPDSFQQPSITVPETSHSITSESEYTRSYPLSWIPPIQQPSLSTRQQPSRPDLILHPDQQQIPYPPALIPGQPQISPPHPQLIPPQKRPEGTQILSKSDDIQPSGLQPGMSQPGVLQPGMSTVPQQPQISPPKPQHSIYPSSTHTTQVGLPGVSEPDTQNCCEALRELKRRCCGKTTRTQNGSSESTCCKSKISDFSVDFSSEDDFDEKSDQPCKVVKAICYIVYKPVGKARVCKPTETNVC